MKHSGYCPLISVPMIGGRSLSSMMPKKKAVNLDLIFRTMAKFLCVTKPTSSWEYFSVNSMYATESAALNFKIVLTIRDPITSRSKLLSYSTGSPSLSKFPFLKADSNLLCIYVSLLSRLNCHFCGDGSKNSVLIHFAAFKEKNSHQKKLSFREKKYT